MSVQGRDDKNQPLRCDGITTIRRTNQQRPADVFTPATDFTLIPMRVITLQEGLWSLDLHQRECNYLSTFRWCYLYAIVSYNITYYITLHYDYSYF